MAKEIVRIKSFEGLRVIFSLLIVLNHCTFFKTTNTGDWIFEHILHNGRYSVTFFFCISSFCLYRKYKEDNLAQKGIVSNIIFSIKRINRIYALYLVCMLWAGIYSFFKNNKTISKDCFRKVLLTFTLTQTWNVKWWSIYNSVSWYLSTLFFLYLCAPYMITIIYRVKKSSILQIIFALLLWIILYEYLVSLLHFKGFFSEHYAMLLTYVSPLYWIPIYLLGMILERISSENNNFFKGGSISEVFCCLICVVVYLMGLNSSNVFVKHLRTLLYTVSILAMIYVFSFEAGIVSQGLHRLSRFSGLCSEIYLIHFQVINSGGISILNRLGLKSHPFLGAILIIVWTILLSLLWRRFGEKARI